MLDLKYDPRTATLHCLFRGRLDASVSPEAQSEVEKILSTLSRDQQNVSQVEFNLSEVTYASSAFLRVCLAMAKRSEQFSFAVTNCSPEISQLLHVTGLDELVNELTT